MRPIRVGLIGAGRYGVMFLAQVQTTPGIHVVAVADLSRAKAVQALDMVGWPKERRVDRIDTALASGGTAVIEDSADLFGTGIDIIIDATGSPLAGVAFALEAIENGQDIIMVNVEADALAGPALAERARRAGTIYSLAYGDQPAEIAELVDWARTSGFEVVSAGKGTKYRPGYHDLNPDTIWEIWPFTKEFIESGPLNPYLFTSFRDGTKAAIEMAAVANATGLVPSDHGLTFEPASASELSRICVPIADGGVLEHSGTVDVVSSLYRDGTWVPHHLQEGMFVVVQAENPYTKLSFQEDLGWHSSQGKYTSLYRPYHFVGFELGVSVASIATRREATGAPIGFHGDVVCVAKKDLATGDVLDGEGGFAVWGRSVSAVSSVARGALPIGLAHNVPLVRDKARGEIITFDDVVLPAEYGLALELRRETEAMVKRTDHAG